MRDVSVCALVPYPPGTSPSQRFRIEQWLPDLDRHGIRVDLSPFAGPDLMELLHAPRRAGGKAVALLQAFVRRLTAVASIGAYDVIVVHRAIALFGPAVLERLVAARRPVVFDFDDAIFLTHTTAANRRFGWLKCAGKTASVCRLSAHVVVGNEYLAGYARRHNGRVTVVPSSVDVDAYRPSPRRDGGRIVVGWMGSSTSQTHLELFAPMLGEIARRGDVELRVVSDRQPRLDGVPVTWRRWSRETELAELQRFDVGIMPMPDDAWAEGKCAMKALLCMAVGVPVVCSAVGLNRQLIRHGDNGLLATSTADWVQALGALAGSAALRARLGDAGRATVVAEYSRATCALRFAGAIREAVDGRRGVAASTLQTEPDR